MAFINYVKGNKSQYNQGTYPDSIFLAVDKQEIIFQGVSYGTSKDLKAVDSISLNGTGYLSIHYHNGESEGFQLTKAMVGLGNVDNTADVDKPVSNAVNQLVNSTKNTIDNYTVNGKKISSNPTLGKADVGLSNVDNTKQVPYSEKGQAGGVVPLNEEGKIDSVYIDGQQSPVKGVDGTYTSSALPGSPTEGMFVWCSDDNKFREWTGSAWDVVDPKQDTLYNFRNNPPSGDTGRINILFRWDGKAMAEVSSTISIGEVTGTAYDGGKGKANRDAINSLPGTLVSSVSRGTIDGDSITINVNRVTKSGINYGSPAAQNFELPSATTSAAGLMSATDKSHANSLWSSALASIAVDAVTLATNTAGNQGTVTLKLTKVAGGGATNIPFTVTIPLATGTANGVMSAADKAKLDTVDENANNYSLPLASASTRGGIKIGYTTTGKNYAVQLNQEKAFVNVPWTDQNVLQNAAISSNGSYNVLLGGSANTAVQTGAVNKAGGLTYNPSTKVLSTTTFQGALNGNAATATKATQDASGNVITSTYATKSEVTSQIGALIARIAALEDALTIKNV